MHEYHDREWGVPVHDDRVHFEFLVLEGAQAGLSWQTILDKRDRYREVLDGFDVERIARYDRAEARRAPEGRGRSCATGSRSSRSRPTRAPSSRCRRSSGPTMPTSGPSSAAARARTGGGRTARSRRSTAESDALSKDLKKRGFTFVGTTIIYAYMQAVGLVNDHLAVLLPLRAPRPLRSIA